VVKYIILIAVDIIAVIGIVAVFMSAKRRRDHRSLRNPAPMRWGWSLAFGKPHVAEELVKAPEKTCPLSHQEAKLDNAGILLCSLCGDAMVLQTAQKGERAGKPFYGCSNYPKCRNTVQHISLKDTRVMKNILR